MRGSTARLVAGVIGLTLAAPLLSACSPFASVSNQEWDLKVSTSLTNAKIALTAYASTQRNALPDSLGSNLKDYGWSPSSDVTVKYTKGTGANVGRFCLLGTGPSGDTMVATTNTDPVKASSCPDSY